MNDNIIPFPSSSENPSVRAQRELARKVRMCLEAIEGFESKLADRPAYAASLEGSIRLREPACELKCRNCYMQCAIAPERLEWWEKELASFGGVPKWMLRKDGPGTRRL